MDRRPGRRLVGVSLVVGAFSGADPESLQFAMELVLADSPWPEAGVDLREEPVALACRDCGHEFEPAEFDVRCPACGSTDVDVVRGRDLRLESIQIEDDDGPTDTP
jgi:hydrogenase nickel incorporation protein HypA/HybF